MGLKKNPICRLEYVNPAQYSHIVGDNPPEFLILDVGNNPAALVNNI